MKTFELDFGEQGHIGIAITKHGATVDSDLKDKCPYCGLRDCYFNCDQSTYDDELETQEEMIDRKMFNTAIDVVESMVLAHAIAGIDVEAPSYKDGIEQVIKAFVNNRCI